MNSDVPHVAPFHQVKVFDQKPIGAAFAAFAWPAQGGAGTAVVGAGRPWSHRAGPSARSSALFESGTAARPSPDKLGYLQGFDVRSGGAELLERWGPRVQHN